MEIRAAEISDIIKRQIQEYEREVEVRETGRVLSTGDGIARIYGLDQAASGELLEFPHKIYGMVLNLEEDNVGAAVFADQDRLRFHRRIMHRRLPAALRRSLPSHVSGDHRPTSRSRARRSAARMRSW